MTPTDARTPDEPFDSLLAGYHEALAAGLPPAGDTPTADLPSELATQFRKAAAVLDLLEEDRRRTSLSGGGLDALSSREEPPAALAGGKPFGRFRVVRELGRGGFGVVFLAWDPHLRREVALKVPRPEALLAPELRRRFLHEAQAAAGLDHPGVVPVFEVGEVGPIWYIAARYCPGRSLAARLREHPGPIPPRAAARLVAVLADAVHYTHSRGVLHRDLKPANVLLEEPAGGAGAGGDDDWPRAWGLPRVCDFGLARPLEGAADETRTGALVGTPAYMAPEQAAGRRHDVSVATDVWGLGVILYECLTGTRPFRGDSDHDTRQRILAEPPAAPRRHNPAVPRDLEAVCLRCLEKDPAKRYPGALALAEDLRRFLAGEPTQARPAGLGLRAWAWARRRPTLSAVLGVAALAALALGAGAAGHYAALQAVNANLRAALDDAGSQRLRAEARRAESLRQNYAANVSLAGNLGEARQYGPMLERLRLAQPGPGEEDPRGFEWHYLWRLGRRRFDLRGHQGSVQSVAVSPDGKLLASGSDDRTVKLWDLSSGRLQATLQGHTLPVRYVAFSPDGKFLFSMTEPGPNGQGKLWDVTAGAERAGLDFGESGVFCATFLANGKTLVLAGDKGPPGTSFLRLWDTDTGWVRNGRWVPRECIHALKVSPDGNFLAALYDEEVARRGVLIWDLTTGEEKVHRETEESFRHLAFSPDGRTLVFGGTDTVIRCLDVASGEERAGLRAGNQVHSLAVSPDGRTLAAAVEKVGPARQDVIRLWDLATGTARKEALDPGCGVSTVCFTPDGERLVFGGSDHLVHFWCPAERPTFRPLAGHKREVWGAAFSPDGKTLATCGDDDTVKLWDPVSGQARPLAGHKKLVTAIAFAPDGRTLASASFDATVKLWDPLAGCKQRTLKGHEGPVRTLAFSPDGNTLATGGDDRTVRLWEAATGRPCATLTGHDDKVRAVAFSPDGRLLASGANDLTLRLWDAGTGDLLQTLAEPQQVWCLAFSPDGRTLAVGTKDGCVRLRNAGTWDLEAEFQGHVGGVRSVAFSPDGKTLASGGEDRKIKLWHAATRLEVLTLKGHKHWVNAVAFSPDGRTLASASHDGAVLLWEADRPAE